MLVCISCFISADLSCTCLNASDAGQWESPSHLVGAGVELMDLKAGG